MTNSLTGSTALVTGGNSGIGRAAALALAARGAHVVLSGRDARRGEQVVAEIRELGGGILWCDRTMEIREPRAFTAAAAEGSLSAAARVRLRPARLVRPAARRRDMVPAGRRSDCPPDLGGLAGELTPS